MSVRSKNQRFTSRRRPPDLHHHTVEHERIDEGVLRDWKQNATKLGELYDNVPELDSAEVAPDVWRDCLDDAFFQFFGYDEPSVRAAGEVRPDRQSNRTTHEKVARSDTMGQIRPGTKNKAMESTLALMGFGEQLAKEWAGDLKEHVERQQEAQNELERARQTEDDLAKMREENAQAASQGDPMPHPAHGMREATRQREEALAALQELQQQTGAQAPQANGAIQTAVARSLGAAQEAAEAADNVPGIGVGKAPGQAVTVSPDVMLELAQRWSTGRLQQIAEMLGRLLPDMRTERRTKRKGGYEEMVDIELGNDIPVLLPGELARAGHPLMRYDFYKRFTDATLMQYEMWSTEELKRGPMVIVIDESQSMDGFPIIWVKALAIALVFIANREGRNAAVVCYGSRGELRRFFFPKKHAVDPVVLCDMAEHFFCGGTDTVGAIGDAATIMREDAPFHKADMIIGTDGVDYWTDEDTELQGELKGMGVYVHGVSIGRAPSQYLLDWCDHTSVVSDFEGKNDTTDRLATHIA